MSDYPELFMLRHGQTEWNVQGRYQGRQDSPLTPLGLKQAAMQGQILKEILGPKTLPSFCSPQLRAMRTAEIALGRIGLVSKTDARLMEIGFGLWEGQTQPQIAQNFPELSRDDPFERYFSAPKGERFSDLKSRCEAFLRDLTAPAIIVSHGVTSTVLRGLWLDLPKQDMLSLPKAQGCVYHLTHGVERCITL